MDNLGNKLLEIHPKRKVFRGFKIKTDRETGLPELPEGFYWFVSQTDPRASNHKVWVWLYTEDGEEALTDYRMLRRYDEVETVPQAIRFLTKEMVEKELQVAYDKQYFGKYPPKKLEK